MAVENVGSAPASTYYIPFTTRQMETLGSLEVRDRKNAASGFFKVEAAEISPDRYGILVCPLLSKLTGNSDTQFYAVTLPQPLAPKAQITLAISYAYLSALTPLPASIAQKDNQFVYYEFSAYWPSAYTTLKQKTEVKFPGSNIPEYTTLKAVNGAPESPQKMGSKFTYGTFGEVPAGTVEQVRVRYEFTKPLIHVSLLERDVEVSHWGGNIAFEDRYTLHNRAANLSKQFNRVEWAQSQYYKPPTTAIRELVLPLRIGSLTPYFTDVIGNVSTSRFRSNKREANLEIKPRYPIFGGWNYPFRVGWTADLKKFLRSSSGSSYVLNVPFLEGPKQPEGIEYARMELRVILPEGAEYVDFYLIILHKTNSYRNVEYFTTVPIVSATHSLHRTFMDTKGRTMLTLKALNVVDDIRDRELIVTYDYPLSAALRKPIVIFTATLSLFVAVWAIGTMDVGIKGKKI